MKEVVAVAFESLIEKPRIAVIGGGRMGGALARAWHAARLVPEGHLAVVEPDEQTAAALRAAGVRVQDAIVETIRRSDVVILAVKPALVVEIAAQHRDDLAGRLGISIAAGVSLEELARLAPSVRWVRVMPNLPVVVGAGAAALVGQPGLTDRDETIAHGLFAAVGEAIWLEREDLMHVVTGLTGSGPAYVAVFAEALEDAGVRGGLTRALARRLVLQTIAGAARQLQIEELSPAALKDAVASPGGTTIAGLERLEFRGLRAAVMDAVAAATARSRELGSGK